MSLVTESILEFCFTFLGYGNPKANIWYVGMEEGGGKSESEIKLRLAAFKKLEKQPIVDLRLFCRETRDQGLAIWASSDAPRQRTWYGLIKHKFESEGKSLTSTDVDTYQCTKWLAADSDSCMVNLMPLPSPGMDTWSYNDWCQSEIFQSRKKYFEEILQKRIALLRNAIQTHSPDKVVFVGDSYIEYWKQITQGIRDVKFEFIRHPAARGQNGAQYEYLLILNGKVVEHQSTTRKDSYDRALDASRTYKIPKSPAWDKLDTEAKDAARLYSYTGTKDGKERYNKERGWATPDMPREKLSSIRASLWGPTDYINQVLDALDLFSEPTN